MRRYLGIFLAAALLIFSPGTLAGELALAEPDARSFGMGGACVAAVNDATSLYWNPAGLAEVTLVGINLGMGAGTSSLSDLKNLKEAYEAIKNYQIPGQDKMNVPVEVSGGANLCLIGLVGLGYNSLIKGEVGYDATVPSPQMTITADGRRDLAFGMARQIGKAPLGLGELSSGFALKGVTITHVKASKDPATQTVTKEEETTTKAVALDLGLKVKVAKMLTLGLVVKDLGPSQTKDERAGTTQKGWLEPNLTLGAAFTPPVVGLTVEGDVESNGTLRLGVEQSLLLLAVRAGLVKAPAEELEYRLGLGLNLGPVHGNLGFGFQGSQSAKIMADLNFKF